VTLESFLGAVGRSSAKTAEGYGLSVRRFARSLGKEPDEIVEDVKAGRVNVVDLLRQLNEWSGKLGHRSSTTLLYFTGWIQFLRWERIPVDRDAIRGEVRPPKKRKSLGGRPFTRAEITKVLNLVNHKYRTMILVAATSGLRAGEIGALRIGDADFSKSPVEIFVRGESSKSGKDRVAYCSDEAAAHLKALIGERKDRNEFIFSTHGGRFTGDAITAATSRLLKRAGVREKDGENRRHTLSFHSLRKFFTTFMVEAGVPLPIVELLCGREIGTTQSYLMPSHDQMRTYYAGAMQKLVLTQAEATVGNLRETVAETEKRMRTLEEENERLRQQLRAVTEAVPTSQVERLEQNVRDLGLDPDEIVNDMLRRDVMQRRRKLPLMTVKDRGKKYHEIPITNEEYVETLQRFLRGQMKLDQPAAKAKAVRRTKK